MCKRIFNEEQLSSIIITKEEADKLTIGVDMSTFEDQTGIVLYKLASNGHVYVYDIKIKKKLNIQQPVNEIWRYKNPDNKNCFKDIWIKNINKKESKLKTELYENYLGNFKHSEEAEKCQQ